MADKKYLQFAKQMRSNPSQTEEILWKALRARRLGGYKFKRQVPIGSYIADFICEEKKLIIEADGGEHELQKDKDQNRTEILKTTGYHVFRIWNDDIDRDLDFILNAILPVSYTHLTLPTIYSV